MVNYGVDVAGLSKFRLVTRYFFCRLTNFFLLRLKFSSFTLLNNYLRFSEKNIPEEISYDKGSYNQEQGESYLMECTRHMNIHLNFQCRAIAKPAFTLKFLTWKSCNVSALESNSVMTVTHWQSRSSTILRNQFQWRIIFYK